MTLPFTEEQFFALFAAYNRAVWPAQWVLAALALVAVAAVWHRSRRRGVVAAGSLALLWAWTGVAYHWVFFTRINPAAWLFGALFVLQAGLFVHAGRPGGALGFARPGGWRGWTGGVLVAYGLVLYPLLGLALGHPPRELPVLGVPCPTTILTLGVLFWARRPVPRRLLVVPLLWAAVGSTAAFALGVPQDLGLAVAGLAALALLRRS